MLSGPWLFAQTTITVNSQAAIAAVVVLVLVALLAVATNIVSIIKAFRPDKTAGELYAPKSDLKEIHSRLSDVATRQEVRETHRELAREIERVDKAAHQRMTNAISETNQRLKAVESTLQSGFQSFERSLGKLEGYLEQQNATPATTKPNSES